MDLVVSSGMDNKAIVWNTTSSEVIATLVCDNWVSACHFSNDGELVFLGDYNNEISIWDLKSSTKLSTLRGHTGSIRYLCTTNEGNHLVSSGGDSEVRIWDLLSKSTARVFKGHAAAVNYISISSDDSLIVSASYDSTMRLWNTVTGAAVATLRGHTKAVTSACFDRCSTVILSASLDKTVRTWDSVTYCCLMVFNFFDSFVDCAIFNHSGTSIAAATTNSVVVFNAASKEIERTMTDAFSVVKLSFNSSDTMLAGAGQALYLWSLVSEDEPTVVLTIHDGNPVLGVDFQRESNAGSYI